MCRALLNGGPTFAQVRHPGSSLLVHTFPKHMFLKGLSLDHLPQNYLDKMQIPMLMVPDL